MTTAAQDLAIVTTRIEPDLARRLEEKRKAADRSLAAEIRQAIRAWVGEDAESSAEATATQEASPA
jgi:predicted transcriptional regulator